MELSGKIAVKFYKGQLLAFCKKYIANFDTARYEIIAVRVFAATGFVVTVYAVDNLNPGTSVHVGKLPVKKFKLENVNAADLPMIVEAFNFTITSGDHNLDEIEVINK